MTKKNLDQTTIADRLKTVSWNNKSNPTGVVKPVDGYPAFPLTAKGDTFQNVFTISLWTGTN